MHGTKLYSNGILIGSVTWKKNLEKYLLASWPWPTSLVLLSFSAHEQIRGHDYLQCLHQAWVAGSFTSASLINIILIILLIYYIKRCDQLILDLPPCLFSKEWVRSIIPYPISLNLRTIRDILDEKIPMDPNCFNMAVRTVACDDAWFLIDDIKYRFMDLKFCVS